MSALEMPNQPAMFGEYQTQLDEAMRRKQLAQMIAAQGMKPQQMQMAGRVMPRMSPLSGIAQALTGYLGMQEATSADQAIRQVQDRFSRDQLDELSGILKPQPQQMQMNLGGPEEPAQDSNVLVPPSEKDQIAKALLSRFPMVRAKGLEMEKDYANRLKEFQANVRERDPQAAARAAISGNLPGGWNAPQIPTPTFYNDPAGNALAETTNKFGEKRVIYAPKPNTNTVDIKLPGKEAEMALDITKSSIAERQKMAFAAKETVSSVRGALEALQQGAQAGGGQQAIQFLRKAVQSIGGNLPNTQNTETLTMALGDAVLSALAKVRPASDKDIIFLEKLKGSISTDPGALAEFMARAQAVALADLQEYRQYVDEKSDAMTSPNARQILAGEKVGFDKTVNLPGSQADQFRTLQEMNNRGADMSEVRIGGKPLEPGAQFDIRGPFNPAQKRIQQGAAKPGEPVTVDQLNSDQLKALAKKLTPAQKAALKAELGL